MTPKSSKHINIDTILENLDTGKYLGLGGTNYAKQQLYDLMLEIIGEDEPVITKIGKGSISRGKVVFTNRLRQEQRTKLSQLFNITQ